MKTALFRIEGMSCEGCADTIETLVEREPGVRMASVSFDQRRARVLYDPRLTGEQRLVDAIQRPGFRVVARESEGKVIR